VLVLTRSRILLGSAVAALLVLAGLALRLGLARPASHAVEALGTGRSTVQDPAVPFAPATPGRVSPDLPLAETAIVRAELEAVLDEPPTAKLEVRFRHADGTPVSGVRVRLVPGDAWTDAAGAIGTAFVEEAWGPDDPSLRIREALGRVETSDSDGVASWDGVAPGAYRWSTEAAVVVDPPHELQSVRALPDGTFVREADPPPGESGAFELAAGETRRFEATVLVPATVIGRLGFEGTRPAEDDPLVRIFAVRVHEGPASAVRMRNEEGVQPVEREGDGSFRFDDVLPGEKLVRAVWQSDAEEIFFARRRFEVGPGELVDLGRLEAGQGYDVDVHVRAVDQRGEELPEAEGEVDLMLRVPDPDPDLRMLEELPAAVNRSFRLRGLPAGRAFLEVLQLPEAPHGFRLERTGSVPFDVPSRGVVRVDLVARPLVTRSIEVVAPDAVDGRFRARLWTRELPGGDWRRVSQFSRRDFRAELHLEPGTHRILGMSDAQNGAVPSLYAEAVVDFDPLDTSEIRLEWMPAAAVQGEARGADGRPVRDASVLLALEGEEAAGYPWAGITDAEGRFTLLGLLPLRRYVFLDGTTYSSGAEGTTGRVVLTVE